MQVRPRVTTFSGRYIAALAVCTFIGGLASSQVGSGADVLVYEAMRFEIIRQLPKHRHFVLDYHADTRLIGRSVWNTDWMMIIPGGTFLADPDEGLDTFIRSNTDILFLLQSYSYSGN